MRKLFAVPLLLSFMCGCTTLQFPQSYSTASAIEQQLRWQALENAAFGVMKYDTVRIDEIRSKLAYKKDELRFSRRKDRPAIEREIRLLTQRLDNLSNLKIVLKRLETTRLYVDIQPAGERNYAYRYIILNSLKAKNLQVAPSENEADYTLRVTVKQDGVDKQFFNLLFVFWSNKLMGTAEMDISITDVKTGAEVYEDTVQGDAYFTRSYLLGLIGPLNSTSIQ